MRGNRDGADARTEDRPADRDAIGGATGATGAEPVPRRHRHVAAVTLAERPLTPCRPATLVVRGRATALKVTP